MRIAHFGTFDVDNFGDLLFPLILEKWFDQSDVTITHASPNGGRSSFLDSCNTVATSELLKNQTDSYQAVIIGGGHIITDQTNGLAEYQEIPFGPGLAYPSLWIGATEWGMQNKLPIFWNAAGIPSEFASGCQLLVSEVISAADYCSVRDKTSLHRLSAYGSECPATVVPDTAIEVQSLWEREDLIQISEQFLSENGIDSSKTIFVVHLSRRFLQADPEQVASWIKRTSEAWKAIPVFVPLGKVHGDGEFLKQCEPFFDFPHIACHDITSLKLITSLFQRSIAYLGSSLHGLITAAAFDIPGVCVIPDQARTLPKFEGWSKASGIPLIRASSLDKLDDFFEVPKAFNVLHHEQLRIAYQDKVHQHRERLVRGVLQTKEVAQRENRLSNWESVIWTEQSKAAQEDLKKQNVQYQELLKLVSKIRSKHDQIVETLQGEKGLLKQDIKSLKGTVNQHQAEINKLISWLDEVSFLTNEVSQSTRWQVGNLIANIFRSTTLQGKVPTAVDYLRSLHIRFQQWKENSDDFFPERVSVQANQVTSEQARKPSLKPKVSLQETEQVAIVICVHNALQHIQACLESIEKHSPNNPLILIDDGSEEETAGWLKRFQESSGRVRLFRNEEPIGYTRSANKGMSKVTSDWAVLLNSDTVVTEDWIEGLLTATNQYENVGMVSPVSNAASWQSIPDQVNEQGNWSINQTLSAQDPNLVTQWLKENHTATYPIVPLLNGFCLLIRNALFQQLDGFDETRFPLGYGEENDLCFRIQQANSHCVIDDQTFVYHAKSQSFQSSRASLAESGEAALSKLYGKPSLLAATESVKEATRWATLRKNLSDWLQQLSPEFSENQRGARSDKNKKLLFLLPVRAGGGGVHSVVQESLALKQLGSPVKIAIEESCRASFLKHYPEPEIQSLFISYQDEDSLKQIANDFKTVIATIYHSVTTAARLQKALPHLQVAYYIQDYEPWFQHLNHAARQEALNSYQLIDGCLLFAKTEWLCELVEEKHQVPVTQIPPSIDHQVYFPNLTLGKEGVVRITAMIRPTTPRRAPSRTMKVLTRIAERYGDRVEIHLFGSETPTITAAGIKMDSRFLNHGILARRDVADLLRMTDIFVDFSDYQAFGRTALEAMACRTAVVVPQQGGANVYAKDQENALIVDTNLFSACEEALARLVEDKELQDRLKNTGLVCAQKFTVQQTAIALWELTHTGMVSANHESKPASEETSWSEAMKVHF